MNITSEFNQWHPTLQSKISGISKGDIVAFLGLPYGIVTKRWTYATVRNEYPSSFNATKPGRSKCPQLEPDDTGEYGPALEEMVVPEDEFECLNLNIVAPKAAKDLPVLVYFHGGANLHGSASKPATDATRLVAWSIKRGQPIVAVAVNWRYGTFGLMYSTDLDQTNTDGTFRGNYSLHDQRIALQWIQKHIAGFGGDPSRVTISGQSSGGCKATSAQAEADSTNAHIAVDTHLSDQPRTFANAIIQSGPLASRHMWSMKRMDRAWNRILLAKGIQAPSAEQRVAMMRNIPADELCLLGRDVAKVTTWGYFIDGVFCPPELYDHRQHYRVMKPRPDAILIGDNADERSVFLARCRQRGVAPLEKAILNELDPQVAQTLLENYGIPSSSTTDHLSHCAQHMRYWMPTDALADALPTAFRYHLAMPNPFPECRFKGLAHHSIDLMYIYRNWNEYYEERGLEDHLAMSNTMGSMWLDFTYGKLPWSGAQPDQGAYLGQNGLEITSRDGVRKAPEMQSKADLFKNIVGLHVTGRIADGYFSEQNDRRDEPFIS